MRLLRSSADRFQLVSQPALSQVPVDGPRSLAGQAGAGVAAGTLLPCGVHRSAGPLLGLQNQRRFYALLFRAVSQTLLEIAADRRLLGARIGFLAVLHTWTQTLLHHPHVHCLVPAGGLALDGSRWISCRPKFFLPVEVLSCRFRRK